MSSLRKHLPRLLGLLTILLSTGFFGASATFGTTAKAFASSQRDHELAVHSSPGARPDTGSCPANGYTDVHTSDYFYDPVNYLCAGSAVFGYTTTSNPTCASQGAVSPCFLPSREATRADLVLAVVQAQRLVNPADSNWAPVSEDRKSTRLNSSHSS